MASAEDMARLLMTVASELSAAPERAPVPVGIPIVEGRFSLGRLRRLVQPDPSAPVAVVTAFGIGAWLGRDVQRAPQFGRLSHRTEADVDRRGRMRLPRLTRAYLDVADPAAFEVVPVQVDGGVMLLPLEGFDRRCEGLERCL